VGLSIFAIFLLLAIPAFAVALFRYRGAARDEGTLEYVFEADEQSGANVATKEKVAEIGADVMTTFYHVNVGALETQKFRTTFPTKSLTRCLSIRRFEIQSHLRA
jgi:hypothetical protein